MMDFEWLTPHKKRVLFEVAKGKTNKEIAIELNISEDTVRNHIHKLFNLCDVQNRTELTIWSLKNKVLNLEEL